MFLERARAGEYNRDGKAWSDQPGSGNDLTSPTDMARSVEAIEQGVGLSADCARGDSSTR